MKYPIGIQDFESIINDGYVYVDKTALVYRLVTEGEIMSLAVRVVSGRACSFLP